MTIWSPTVAIATSSPARTTSSDGHRFRGGRGLVLANFARPPALFGIDCIVTAMSDPAPRPVERHCDVAVIGGSAAGLAAALQLGRQRRSVIVVDSGEPRNAPAEHMHSYLGYEGRPPSELTAVGREEVRSYGGEILAGRVSHVTRTDDGGFRVELVGGNYLVARRVVAAIGLVDELPDIDGLAGHWGRDVIHCPFCHGFEVRDRRIVQVVTHPMGLHTVVLWRQLSAQLTVVLHDPIDVDGSELDALRASGVDVRYEQASRIVTGVDGHVMAVELSDHERIDADAVVVGPRFTVRAEPFASLGVAPAAHPSGLGDFLEADATGATAVPGLYAAGNVTDPSQQVLQAAAHGSRVGAMISFSLAEDDTRAGTRSSANEADWDHRYGGDLMWSGNPNGTLVTETSGLVPGRALDVGAGEGGDALWLAEQGWSVTASDISQRALDRVSAEAERRGLRVECHHADANALDAYETASLRPRVGAVRIDSPHARWPWSSQRPERSCSGRHAACCWPRSRADASAGRDTGPQPAVRPRCLRTGRRLRSGARRLISMGYRGTREATPTTGGSLCFAPC